MNASCGIGSLGKGCERFNMCWLAIFAGLAAGVGSVGIYGVDVVCRHTDEHRSLAFAWPLGARGIDVLGLDHQNGLTLTLVGRGNWHWWRAGATRLLRTLLFGVAPTDAFTFATVSVVLIIVRCWPANLPRGERQKSIYWWRCRYEKAQGMKVEGGRMKA